jgi:hypothetical protein
LLIVQKFGKIRGRVQYVRAANQHPSVSEANILSLSLILIEELVRFEGTSKAESLQSLVNPGAF